MKKLFVTVLTLVFALGSGSTLEGIDGQMKKEGKPAPSPIEPGPAGQTSEEVGPAGENQVSDETDSSKENVPSQLDVAVGQEFSITLASNATTGYHWELAAPLDEAVVKLVASQYKTHETKMLGAGGQEIWTFTAVGRGQTVVQLKYVRPWEKDVPPVKTASYVVIVR
jgi:predicted secreted protein